MSSGDIRDMINKKYGKTVAFDLREESPTEVSYWVPTGSRWLDSIICKGQLAGFPSGRVSSLAGEESAGKSYLAAQAVANAQGMGIPCVYFDSESAVSPPFFEEIGIDLESLIYVQAKTCEFVLETIEMLLQEGTSYFFVWDSIAFTPCQAEMEAGMDPTSNVAIKARVLSVGMTKLIDPIADTKSVLLVLNQLKTNITSDRFDRMMNPFFTPGGKSLKYAYSLEIWLTRRKSKSSYEYDERGYQTGGEVKALIKKSRFGTERRECAFRIMWGDQVKVLDEESWFEAIKNSEHVKAGAWNKIQYSDGTWTGSFRSADWLEMLESDEKFKQRVLELMDEEIIQKFQDQTGDASTFYDIDGEKSESGKDEEE
jgi:recombination protein RecA